MIAEYMSAVTNDERERTLKVINKNTIRYHIAPTEKVQEIKVFVNSTHFLYVPLTPEEVYNYPIKNVITRPDPTNLKAIWNIDKLMLSQHKRLAQPGAELNSVQSLVSALRAVNTSAIDPTLKQELLSIYAKINGQQ
jgi:hypothetical protein